jgi:hypothetical protein
MMRFRNTAFKFLKRTGTGKYVLTLIQIFPPFHMSRHQCCGSETIFF